MEEIKNLWPDDLGTISMTLPKEILTKQAVFLSEMTKNLLVPEITTTQAADHNQKDVIIHEFIIKAPAMGNYQFTLFRLWHDYHIYPTFIYDPLAELKTEINNEKELLDCLTKIFNSEKTKLVVSSMIAQSK